MTQSTIWLVTAGWLIASAAHAQVTQTYTYDANGRLTGVSTTGGSGINTAAYAYDDADNRTGRSQSGAAAYTMAELPDDPDDGRALGGSLTSFVFAHPNTEQSPPHVTEVIREEDPCEPAPLRAAAREKFRRHLTSGDAPTRADFAASEASFASREDRRQRSVTAAPSPVTAQNQPLQAGGN